MQVSEQVAKQLYDLCQGKPFDTDLSKKIAALLSPGPTSTASHLQNVGPVAVLGLGAMGKGIAGCLEKGGVVTKKWNRSSVPERTAETIEAAVAGGVNVVFTMLADDVAVSAVSDELFKHLSKGAIHVSLSTISVRTTKRLEKDHSERGFGFVSCPVFGRPGKKNKFVFKTNSIIAKDAAAKGILFALPGGDSKAIEMVTPYLQLFTQKLFRFEKPEQSSLAKLCGNFFILTQIEALGEIFCAAEKGGISNRNLLDMFLGTIFNSPIVNRYGNILVNREFSPAGFQMNLGLKDCRFFLEACEDERSPAPFASIVKDRFLQTLADAEKNHLDWSAIFLSIRESSGLK